MMYRIVYKPCGCVIRFIKNPHTRNWEYAAGGQDCGFHFTNYYLSI